MSTDSSSPAASTVLPRFEVSNYVPDGGFNAAGMMMLITALVLAGGALGFAAHWVAKAFYLIILFPAVIGFLLGAVGMRMIRQGRVRNPWIGGLAGFLGGALAMSMMHYFDYREFTELFTDAGPELRQLAGLPEAERAKALPPEMKPELRHKFLLAARMMNIHSFVEYMNFAAEQGVEITSTHGSDKGLNLGYYGSWIYWLVELLIVAGITFGMTHESAAQPYCAQCEQWKTSKQVGTFTVPQAAVQAVTSGDLNAIRAAVATIPGPVVATLSCCDGCAGQGPIDLKLELITFDKKKNKNTRKLAHVTYPGEALPHMLAAFTPAPAAPLADPAAAAADGGKAPENPVQSPA